MQCPMEHARNMDASCGAVKDTPNGEPSYRCDRQPDHYGQHHACGETWEENW